MGPELILESEELKTMRRVVPGSSKLEALAGVGYSTDCGPLAKNSMVSLSPSASRT